MKIQIEAPWSVNDYTREVIENQLEKLSIIDDRIIHADVYLKMGDQPVPNDKVMEVILRLPGPEISAKANESSIEKSAAACAEKLRRQLVKRKEKRSKHL